MAAPALARPAPLPVDRLERLWGWGRATSAMSWVWRPTTVDGIREVFAVARAHGLSVGLRAAGQSYGDAALNAENVCLDLSRMRRILAWDPAGGVITVEPGVTIRDLWQYVLEDGWWPAVVPGTMFAAVGGCAAMNVHGKNNWKVGPIGEHVLAVELLLPDGEVRRCSRSEEPELFHSAIGGFGMLGCFVSVTLQLKRVHSGLLAVEALPARSLGEMMARFEERLASADYLVGWIDAWGTGAGLGRGVLHRANHLAAGDDPLPAQTLRVTNQELPDTFFGVVPKSVMWRLVRPCTVPPGVRAVNAAKYHLARAQGRHEFRQSHAAFAFLLDYIPDWKLALGPGGLIQYQSLVPTAEAERVFTEQLRRAQRAALVPYLGVFKRHRADPFLVSHGLDGYSLALEFKVTRGNRDRLWALAAELDRLVVDAGGRFYFAKDSTLGRASLERWRAEERVQRFLALKRRHDPEERLQTDLYRRLVRPA
jgi:FAD/FMN-containing dehydrogenase